MITRSEQLVTVFGGSGFIGRYVCERLLKAGVRIRVATRHPRGAYFLQTLAQVGQWGAVRADVTNRASVRDALDGASAAINLPGVLGGNFRGVHVHGARNVAEEAAAAGLKALVHVSAIGADPNAEPDYARTKGEGEVAVREAFPGATIVRPSLVVGPEDQITNRLAALSWLPYLPVVAPRTRVQPVYAADLGKAIAMAALDPGTYAGKTFEIGGPEVLTMHELAERVMQAAGTDTQLADLPDAVASAMSRFGFLPGAPLTREQWLMLQHDNVAAPGSAGLEAFGIKGTPLSAVAGEWLLRFRRGGRFAVRPPQRAKV
jgi:NADH dehydrogenase